MGQLIVDGGGNYSKNLTKDCTHLVIKKVEGKRSDISAKERYVQCQISFVKDRIAMFAVLLSQVD